jgi:hypothetical protein
MDKGDMSGQTSLGWPPRKQSSPGQEKSSCLKTSTSTYYSLCMAYSPHLVSLHSLFISLSAHPNTVSRCHQAATWLTEMVSTLQGRKQRLSQSQYLPSWPTRSSYHGHEAGVPILTHTDSQTTETRAGCPALQEQAAPRDEPLAGAIPTQGFWR